MSVYVTKEYYIKLPNGMVPWLMTADTKEELIEFAAKLEVDEEFISNSGYYTFCFISASKAKLARNLGAIYGEEANHLKTMKRHLIKKGLLSYEKTKTRDD